ncbi:tetratricopeptide repeat-containing sensor histidine kinase [Runella sp.]|uniref:tetratricopeptide repeat-containing sensor histidine kinase n=1 Tax=Runella sp. TaxID=1960881 RepID=UPI003D123FD7
MRNFLVFLLFMLGLYGRSNAQPVFAHPPRMSFNLALPHLFPAHLPTPYPPNFGQFTPAHMQAYDSLLHAYQQTISTLQKVKRSPRQDSLLLDYLHDISLIHFALATLRGGNGFDEKAKEYFNKQLAIAKKAKHELYEIEAYDGQESCYQSQGDFIKALEVALARTRRCDRGFNMSCDACNMIPECYLSVARYYAFLNDEKSALTYYRKAIQGSVSSAEKEYSQTQLAGFYIYRKQPEKALEVINLLEKNPALHFYTYPFLTEKAYAYLLLNHYSNALDYANKAIEADKNYRRIHKQPFLSDAYIGLFAQIYLGMKQPEKALKYAVSTPYISDPYESGSKILYLIYKEMGDVKKAMTHFEEYMMETEYITNLKNQNQLAIQQRNYEVEKVQLVADNQRVIAGSLQKINYFLWGILLLTALFTGILSFFYYRIRQQKKQIGLMNDELEEKVTLRTIELSAANAELLRKNREIEEAFWKGQSTERKRVSADLHDEIGSALSTIAIFSDLTKRKAQKTAPELVGELERIGLKSREMIQTMRDTIRALNEDNPQSIWDRMQQYGIETLAAKNVALNWQITSDTAAEVPFAAKRTLFLAFKEALNNIIKHAEATSVSVKNEVGNGQLTLIITDNGKGFDVGNAQNHGNGLRNFEERMKEIGGKINIESNAGKGTVLAFTMPLHIPTPA